MFENHTAGTRERIVEATLRCVERWGAAKTSLNDIAKEARVTRPTVYSYFSGRDDVLRFALAHAGAAFAERVKAHVAGFAKPRDRVVEAMLFALRELPKEPYLASVSRGDITALVNEHAVASAETQRICLDVFAAIFDGRADLLRQLPEIVEVATRWLLSFLVVEGPVKRDEAAMRAFLRRRLLPALGLD